MRSQAERCAPHSHVGKSPLGAVDDANLMRAVHRGVIEHETRVGHAVHEHDAGVDHAAVSNDLLAASKPFRIVEAEIVIIVHAGTPYRHRSHGRPLPSRAK